MTHRECARDCSGHFGPSFALHPTKRISTCHRMHISGGHEAFNAGTVLVQHSMSTFQHAPGHVLKEVCPIKCLIKHSRGAAHAHQCVLTLWPWCYCCCCPCSLHNPLQRQERLSTGWFGVVCSFDGVLVEDTHHAQARAWIQVAEELSLPRPLGQALNRIKGARDEVVSGHILVRVPGSIIAAQSSLFSEPNTCCGRWTMHAVHHAAKHYGCSHQLFDSGICLVVCMQVIMQLFHWTRNPAQVSNIAQRKEEIYDSIMNGTQPAEVPGCRGFLDTLRNYNVSAVLLHHPGHSVRCIVLCQGVRSMLHMLLVLACLVHALLTCVFV